MVLKYSPLKNGAWTARRSFLRKLLYATEPAAFCSEPLLITQYYERGCSAIQKMTHQEAACTLQSTQCSIQTFRNRSFSESMISHSSHPESCQHRWGCHTTQLPWLLSQLNTRLELRIHLMVSFVQRSLCTYLSFFSRQRENTNRKEASPRRR